MKKLGVFILMIIGTICLFSSTTVFKAEDSSSSNSVTTGTSSSVVSAIKESATSSLDNASSSSSTSSTKEKEVRVGNADELAALKANIMYTAEKGSVGLNDTANKTIDFTAADADLISDIVSSLSGNDATNFVEKTLPAFLKANGIDDSDATSKIINGNQYVADNLKKIISANKTIKVIDATGKTSGGAAQTLTSTFAQDFDNEVVSALGNDFGNYVENSFLGSAQFFSIFANYANPTATLNGNIATNMLSAGNQFGTNPPKGTENKVFNDYNYFENIDKIAGAAFTRGTSKVNTKMVVGSNVTVGEQDSRPIVSEAADILNNYLDDNEAVKSALSGSAVSGVDKAKLDQLSSENGAVYSETSASQYINVENELNKIKRKSVMIAKMPAQAVYTDQDVENGSEVTSPDDITIKGNSTSGFSIAIGSGCTSKSVVIHVSAKMLATSSTIKISGLQAPEGTDNSLGLPTKHTERNVFIVVDTNNNEPVNINAQVELQYVDSSGNNVGDSRGQSAFQSVTDVKNFRDNTLMWSFVNKDADSSSIETRTPFSGTINSSTGFLAGAILAPAATLTGSVNIAGNVMVNSLKDYGGTITRWDCQGYVTPYTQFNILKYDSNTSLPVAKEDTLTENKIPDGFESLGAAELNGMSYTIKQYKKGTLSAQETAKTVNPIRVITIEQKKTDDDSRGDVIVTVKQMDSDGKTTSSSYKVTQKYLLKSTDADNSEEEPISEADFGAWAMSLSSDYQYVVNEDSPPEGYENNDSDNASAVNTFSIESTGAPLDVGNQPLSVFNIPNTTDTATSVKLLPDCILKDLNVDGINESNGVNYPSYVETARHDRLTVSTDSHIVYFEKFDKPITLNIRKYDKITGKLLGDSSGSGLVDDALKNMEFSIYKYDSDGKTVEKTVTAKQVSAVVNSTKEIDGNPYQDYREATTSEISEGKAVQKVEVTIDGETPIFQNNWNINLHQLGDGEYGIEEITPPDGYRNTGKTEDNSEIQKFVIKEGVYYKTSDGTNNDDKLTKVTSESDSTAKSDNASDVSPADYNTDNFYSPSSNFTYQKFDMPEITISAKKYDSKLKTFVAGNVATENTENSESKLEFSIKNSAKKVVAKLNSSNNWKVTLDKDVFLPDGNYKIVETTEPTGYILDDDEQDITIENGRVTNELSSEPADSDTSDDSGTDNLYFGEHATGENENIQHVVFHKFDKAKAKLTVKKYSTTGEEVTSDLSEMKIEVTKDRTEDTDLTSANKFSMAFDDGNYTIREINPPDKYKLNDSTYSFTIDDGKLVEGSKSSTADSKDTISQDQDGNLIFKKYDTPNVPTITIRKFDATSKTEIKYDTQGNLGISRLSGLEFTLGTYKTASFSTDPVTTQAYSPDKNGNITIPLVSDANYSLKETGAPDKYDKSSSTIYFSYFDNAMHTYNKNSGGNKQVVTETWKEPAKPTDPTSQAEGLYTNGTNSFVYLIYDQKTQPVLPHTGGTGILPFIIGGIALISSAGALYFYRKSHAQGVA